MRAAAPRTRGKRADADIARRDATVRIRHADDRFVEVLITKPHRTQQGPVGGALHALRDGLASAVVRHHYPPEYV
ncbi:hypothetical protein [Acidithiobacillus sp.]|uniref:hypothetical protein n=1 Tax=Acidithiobacillus sp. TaxID=1872118 RepID=UPI00261CB0AB|nr:hypothetical protein [Acidithiobacillus sp.]